MKLRLLIFSVFALLTFPFAAHAQTFSNPQNFASPAPTDQDDNPFTTYPSEVAVSGMAGTITDLNVTLKNINANDVFNYTRYLLVAPDGTGVRFWAGEGGTASNVTLVVDQQAPTVFPTPDSTTLGPNNGTVYFRPSIGTYLPYTSSTFPPPAVVPADISPDLNRFNGHEAVGTWRLYGAHAYSYMGYNSVSISGGWSLDIKTTGDITAPKITKPAVSGKTIGFDLDEASTLELRVERVSKGVKVRSKCLAPKRGRKGKSCSRYTLLPGAVTLGGVAGVNTFVWSGKIGSKRLAPGKYRLSLIARDGAGNASAPQTFTVTIKKPKKKKR